MGGVAYGTPSAIVRSGPSAPRGGLTARHAASRAFCGIHAMEGTAWPWCCLSHSHDPCCNRAKIVQRGESHTVPYAVLYTLQTAVCRGTVRRRFTQEPIMSCTPGAARKAWACTRLHPMSSSRNRG